MINFLPEVCFWWGLGVRTELPNAFKLEGFVSWVRSLGLRRSPGEGKGYPLQFSGLENSMDCIVHGVAKSWTRLRDFHFTVCPWRTPCSGPERSSQPLSPAPDHRSCRSLPGTECLLLHCAPVSSRDERGLCALAMTSYFLPGLCRGPE